MKEFDKINMLYGSLTALFASILGKYWYLFAGFLLLNVVDYITGWIKAKYFLKNTSSEIGAKGAVKKVMYWVIVGISFFMARCFVKIGFLFDTDLAFMYLLGYFTLATYAINEIRSILENCVVMGVKVPKYLTKGLDVAEKLIEEQTEQSSEKIDKISKNK